MKTLKRISMCEADEYDLALRLADDINGRVILKRRIVWKKVDACLSKLKHKPRVTFCLQLDDKPLRLMGRRKKYNAFFERVIKEITSK